MCPYTHTSIFEYAHMWTQCWRRPKGDPIFPGTGVAGDSARTAPSLNNCPLSSPQVHIPAANTARAEDCDALRRYKVWYCLRPSFTKPRKTSHLLYGRGWPWIYYPPASTSQVTECRPALRFLDRWFRNWRHFRKKRANSQDHGEPWPLMRDP